MSCYPDLDERKDIFANFYSVKQQKKQELRGGRSRRRAMKGVEKKRR